jgi:hypothetical protein
VFSRLALNYMHHDALREIARVARDGAAVVVCVNTLSWHVEQLRRQLRRLQLKPATFGVLTLMNGALYHAFGRQLTLRRHIAMLGVDAPIFYTPRSLRRDFSRQGLAPGCDDGDRYPLTPTFHATRRPRGGRP